MDPLSQWGNPVSPFPWASALVKMALQDPPGTEAYDPFSAIRKQGKKK